MKAVLQESVRTYTQSSAYRRAHLLYLGIVGVLLLILWPSAPYIDFFKLASYPPLFEISAIAVLLLVASTAMYVGKGSLARGKIVSNTDWIEKTRVSAVALIGGRVVAGTLHTVAVTAIAFPFLVVAAGPSGAPFAAVGQSLLVVAAAALMARFGGVFIDIALERRPVLSVLASWAVLGLLYIVSIELIADMNPIIAITAIAGNPDLTFAEFRMSLEPFYLRSVLLNAVSATVFVASSVVALVLRRRRFRIRERERYGSAHYA